VGFTEAVRTGFAKYAAFTGRAARPEYWYWALFVFVVSIVLAIIDGLLFDSGIRVLQSLFDLAVLLPGIAVAVRRLHDIDRSGWWLLLGFLPVVGAIILLIWFCLPGTPGRNRFG
jgi:uncharacterized membrane protein YhaH (DUF805 family)